MQGRSLQKRNRPQTICHVPPDDPLNFYDMPIPSTVARRRKYIRKHLRENPLDKVGSCVDHCETLCDPIQFLVKDGGTTCVCVIGDGTSR